ncbi:serine hydrolase domain-containing protein [Flagellimonas allohymeniacidonis]|uniref:Class A beta-lactamase-related serine hydrolase n=1 Tax=Flagellimonas allohymeniacidonis TaxID=2517819 RepID=A0A4Q8QFM5_9FLAO|nr:serine hydrolase domain-containing protein [Allomuricauda hymeniacidonis]TAI48507.1 class A beta-lactamase-related serine hydrolase [Allomuricauda hymeniacidonis]
MKRTLLITLICIAFFSCKREANIQNAPSFEILKDSLSYELAEIQKQGSIKGFGVAIVNEDTTLYAKGFGHSNVDPERAYTIKTLQNIASVSKTLIGISLLKAQEMDKLSLEDPVNNYLPFEIFNPFHPEDTITIKHLATHTSSIQDGDLYGQKSYILKNTEDTLRIKSIPSAEAFNAPGSDMDMGLFLKNFLSSKGEWYQRTNFLENKPGQLYEYTNVGATLAAYIIEIVTGTSYAEFTKKHILAPLEMTSSGWNTAELDTTLLTQLFTVDGKQIPDYKLITYPDGGLITSVTDKAKYLSEIIRGGSGNGKLLSEKSYRLFFSEFLSESNFEEERDTDRPFDDEYNSGLFIGHTPIGQIGHMGGDPGVSTFMFFDPKTKIGKLLFVNTDLDREGADEFYNIWDKLGVYEKRMGQQTER